MDILSKWYYGLIVIGVCLCVAGGVMAALGNQGSEVVIEELNPTPTPVIQEPVMIDVQGAVQQPGVYKLHGGIRIVEAIMAAGGLSAKADRAWMAKSINQAEVLRDGAKLYIPAVGEDATLMETQVLGTSLGGTSGRIIHVNSASEAELDSLWGIGAARAKAIIENRPYSSLEELATKTKIPKDVLENNEGKWGL